MQWPRRSACVGELASSIEMCVMILFICRLSSSTIHAVSTAALFAPLNQLLQHLRTRISL
jgi:hypothetical protein